jgi:hypothetical protein
MNINICILLKYTNSGFESFHNLMVNNATFMNVNNTFQTPWAHSNCLIAAENGVTMTDLIPGNSALSGNMKVQSGIISAILPNGCAISQNLNGYVIFIQHYQTNLFLYSLLVGQNYFLSFYYIQVGSTSTTFNVDGTQFLVSPLLIYYNFT